MTKIVKKKEEEKRVETLSKRTTLFFVKSCHKVVKKLAKVGKK
jgi:hypothetical protein